MLVTLLIFFEMAAYVATTPRQREEFLQMYVLGANRMATDYYPRNDPDIRLGDSVRWYLGVTNSMGNVQFVVIRIKLGNETVESPDDLKALPSPALLVKEFQRFVVKNETWEFPLFWQIEDAVVIDGSTYIRRLTINDETFLVEGCSAQHGYNFRFIIELWTWSTDSDALQFGWQVGSERRVAWLQVWFNATASPRL